ncbi:MAG: permease [Candidatus Tenebribacter davisii]|nr:permease [Candidatus Tenebribacter davisii]
MFQFLETFAEYITNLVGLDPTSHWGEALIFFIYDTLKIIILLNIMIFLISYLRSYINPNRLKKVISKVNGIGGHFLASIFGIVTPFCSCSSVPMFIAFVEAGIPVGVTLSFLITSPIVNEAAFAILLASFGWKIALIYVLCGVFVGVTGGLIIGRFKPERWVESYVFDMKFNNSNGDQFSSQKDRISWAFEQVKDIVSRVWYFVLIGIGIGAVIHGWIPNGALAKYAGADNPFSVIVATIFGIPLYSNALGTIPIAEALISKGVGIGTALAFMMAVTALSLPECIILKKVIKPKLIGIFIITTGIGIIFTGYLINFLF